MSRPTLDVPRSVSESQALDQALSIFETTTRASRIIAASKGSHMYITCARPSGQEIQVTKKNTYQLGPNETFNAKKAKEISKNVVDKWITKDTVYEVEWARTTARAIAGEVEKLIKKLDYDRYKFVVQVTIGQKQRQAVKSCSRFLFDAKTDRYSEFIFQNDTLWCLVFTSAMYYE